MQCIAITEFEQVEKIKSNWNTVYNADPNCHVFSSWDWIRGWLEAQKDSWMILALKLEDLEDSESSYIAFLPLATTTAKFLGINAYHKLYMAGNPDADHIGFICLPEYETTAIEAFAIYIQKKLKWDGFHMDDVLDERLDIFLESFDKEQYKIIRSTGTCSPYIYLPDTWETYLQKYIGKWLRRDINRGFKKIAEQEQFSITYLHSSEDLVAFEEQISALFLLHQSKWGKMSEADRKTFHSIFRYCLMGNILWSGVLWDEKIPIGALIGFVDKSKGKFLAYLIGHDSQYEKMKPGKILYADSIKYAIENQIKIYDLGRGKYDYKYDFGAKEFWNQTVWIQQRSWKLATINLGIVSKTYIWKILRKIKHILATSNQK